MNGVQLIKPAGAANLGRQIGDTLYVDIRRTRDGPVGRGNRSDKRVPDFRRIDGLQRDLALRPGGAQRAGARGSEPRGARGQRRPDRVRFRAEVLGDDKRRGIGS